MCAYIFNSSVKNKITSSMSSAHVYQRSKHHQAECYLIRINLTDHYEAQMPSKLMRTVVVFRTNY